MDQRGHREWWRGGGVGLLWVRDGMCTRGCEAKVYEFLVSFSLFNECTCKRLTSRGVRSGSVDMENMAADCDRRERRFCLLSSRLPRRLDRAQRRSLDSFENDVCVQVSFKASRSDTSYTSRTGRR